VGADVTAAKVSNADRAQCALWVYTSSANDALDVTIVAVGSFYRFIVDDRSLHNRYFAIQLFGRYVE